MLHGTMAKCNKFAREVATFPYTQTLFFLFLSILALFMALHAALCATKTGRNASVGGL